jgi:hypothetical protein
MSLFFFPQVSAELEFSEHNLGLHMFTNDFDGKTFNLYGFDC